MYLHLYYKALRMYFIRTVMKYFFTISCFFIRALHSNQYHAHNEKCDI